MKYIYSVGYGSYEESEFTYLYSDECLDKYQLSHIVECAVNDVLKDIIGGNINYDDIMIVKENGPSYQDIHDAVIKKLIEKYNFEELKTQADWNCFGWPSITNYADWGEQRDDTLNKLCDSIDEDIKHDIDKICVLRYMYRHHIWRKRHDKVR